MDVTDKGLRFLLFRLPFSEKNLNTCVLFDFAHNSTSGSAMFTEREAAYYRNMKPCQYTLCSEWH